MGNKARKRGREVSHGEGTSEGPAKRRRQINENDAKLSKLYEELAAESDEVRLEAAKQLIMMFSPENKPQAQDVLKAMNRLMRGLCSQRKAARVGFCVTLTELLRQLLGRKDVQVEGLQLDVSAVMKMVEEKTKVEGNVPGRERRDHLIGTLFGYKAIMQSSILLEPELSLENWNKLLDNIYGMARDVPWLREECGLILVDAVKNLKSQSQPKECVQGIIDRLSLFKLANTPEGVAIWLTVRASDEKLLPEDVWHKKDPLSKKERTRLAKVLKENFHNSSEDGKDETVKSAAANPNPIFTWDLVLSEILLRDENLRAEEKDSAKSEFPQFWIDTVDSNLFAMAASHERKSWGFKLFSTMITRVPEPAISALFSPNLMRTLINQSKKEDRFLHAAALTALKAVQSRAQQDPCSALPIFTALTTKNGTVDLDRITKTKTFEQLLLAADDETLRKIVRHLNSIVLRPDSSEQNVADSRRQVIADILLNTTRQYKRYESYEVELAGKDNWLRNILEIMVDNAYFVPSQNAKTNKVPLPPISEASRNMFRERLSSCLTRLLGVNVGSRTTFAVTIIDLIRTKSASSKSQELVFKGDDSVMNTIKEAFQTLDSISAKGSIGGSEMAAKGFTLLYALTLLQVFNEDGDAVLMLQDLDASRKEMGKAKKGATGDGSDAFIEILLTFLGNPRTLFRKIAEEAFSIFTSEVSSEGLKSLTDILDTEENLEGQRSLFDQGGDEAEEEESSDDSEEDSDVEMIDGEPESGDSKTDDSDSESSGESDSESESSEDEEEEDDAELTQFNNLLALTLQTSKPTVDGEGSDETSDESDMDDEQMMALDPHLSKIFQQRSKTTSKKKEREDAKQNVVQFKSRVLDLLAIFMDKEYSNPLVLEILLPILRRTRATANKQLAEKSSKMLKTYFDTRTKHKAPLPKPDDVEQVWEILSGIHEEASLGGGAIIHANACSNASLHVVKVLVTLDKENYGKVVDVYGETQKKWFMDKKSAIQPALFSQFQNWSVSMHRQR